MMPDEARRALKDAWIGDEDEIEGPHRRGFLALATKIDELHARFDSVEDRLRNSNKTMIGLGVSVVLIIIGAAVKIIIG